VQKGESITRNRNETWFCSFPSLSLVACKGKANNNDDDVGGVEKLFFFSLFPLLIRNNAAAASEHTGRVAAIKSFHH
jgi:hypothetical protein